MSRAGFIEALKENGMNFHYHKEKKETKKMKHEYHRKIHIINNSDETIEMQTMTMKLAIEKIALSLAVISVGIKWV